MNESLTSASQQALAHNAQLLGAMLDCWLLAFRRGELLAGSLGMSPAAALLRHHHQLGLNLGREVFTVEPASQQPHELAFTWWSTVREHGLARRENRKPHGNHASLPPLLSELPWPVWVLFEIDQAFDEAYAFASTDEASLEVLLSPEVLIYRLQMTLHALQGFFPLTLGEYDRLDARLTAAV